MRGVDKVGVKDDVEGAVHDNLEDLTENNEAVVDHQAVAKFLALPQPTFDANLHGIHKLCWEVPISGNALLKMLFLVWMVVAVDFTPTMSALCRPNK